MRKKLFSVLLLGFLSFALLVPGVDAVSVKGDRDVRLPQGERVDGSFFGAGNSVTIDGDVDGDVMCAAQSVTINGNVSGDVLCGAQSITVNGNISGNLRVAAQNLDLNGIVDKNVSVFVQKADIGPTSMIGGELFIGGQEARVNGTVRRDIYGGLQRFDLVGFAGRNVTVDVEKLTVHSGASIAGDLKYKSTENAYIDPSGVVAGKVMHEKPKVKEKRETDNKNMSSVVTSLIMSILTSCVLALVLTYVWPKRMHNLLTTFLPMGARPLLWGLGIMFLTPIVVILLLITVIGAPVGIVLALLWLLMLIVSRSVVSVAVGQYMIKNYRKELLAKAWVPAVTGAVVTALAFKLPYIGWLFSLVAFWWGTGVLYRLLRSEFAASK